MCGEKCFRSAVRSSSTGSPPRMRGKAAMVAAFASLLRITPAYAGKRTKPAWNWLRARDHPRVCGEKKIAGKTHALASGSPPPVRGKAFQRVKILLNLGITPACAVKRFQFVLRLHAPGDYPRVCGEKTLSSVKSSGVSGSPPHVRGKGLEKLAHERRRGITPAYAGKSPLSESTSE